MGQLDGRVAIVTGAASGQGAATAALFAAEGARVHAVDRREPAAPRPTTPAGTIIDHRLDITDEAGWADLVGRIEAEGGRADILVNNAAIAYHNALAETSPADFRRVLEVNLVGAFLGARAVAPGMIAAGRGAIVNISSVNGLRGTAGMTAYDASKWGLRGLSRSLALELAPHGIRVNTVFPGAIDTPMLHPNGRRDEAEMMAVYRIPLGRVGLPEEVARVSLFLVCDQASYLAGAEIAVDGAWSAGVRFERAGGPVTDRIEP